MIWWEIVKLAILAVVSYLLAPKPEDAVPVGLDELDIPTPDSKKPIPVVFGTVWIKSSNIVWYGDLATQEIKADSGK